MEITLHRKSMDSGTSVTSSFRDFLRLISAIGRGLTGLLKKAQAASDSALRIEERLSLGPKKMLYLVRCREKEFLIATGNDAAIAVIEVSEKRDQFADSASTSIKRAQKRERAL
jgi:flagellar biogenesis protein FliO